MKPYDPKSPLFSLHIPKCGGTSLLDALQTWFWRWWVIQHYPRHGEPVPKPARVGAKMCVHGHFNGARGHGVLDVYPQARQFITFLREPFDRYVSLWHFLPKVAQERADNEWLKQRPDFATTLRRRSRRQRTGNNGESLIWYFPQRLDAADAGTQMDRSFVFVGVMERYQESLDALAAALDKKRLKVAHLNQTERTAEYEEWRRFYRRHFADEYAVYEAALRRNDELLKRYS
jgi:hypothetical protein